MSESSLTISFIEPSPPAVWPFSDIIVSIRRLSDTKLARLLQLGKSIRSIGFDDAPFERHSARKVPIAGVVCAGTRFEGMVWGQVARDGFDATRAIERLLLGKK